MLKAHEVPTKPIPDDGIPRFIFGSDDLSAFRRAHCDNAGRFMDPVEFYVIHPDLRGGPALVVQMRAVPGHKHAHPAEEFYRAAGGPGALPPCPHGLALNCLKCYPVQYGRTNARMPK